MQIPMHLISTQYSKHLEKASCGNNTSKKGHQCIHEFLDSTWFQRKNGVGDPVLEAGLEELIVLIRSLDKAWRQVTLTAFIANL